jgi:hypothetical protein
LQKCCLSYYFLSFLFNKIRTREQNRFYLEGGDARQKVAQTIYTHVRKCNNDKIKNKVYFVINWKIQNKK